MKASNSIERIVNNRVIATSEFTNNVGVIKLSGLKFGSINDVRYILEKELNSFKGILKEFHFYDIKFGDDDTISRETNAMEEKAVEIISKFLLSLDQKEQLNVINIRGNGFNAIALNEFISMLIDNNSSYALTFPNLKQIDLSENLFNDGSALSLAVIISHSAAIKSLKLAKCALTDSQLDKILKAFNYSANLNEIDLTGNKLSTTATLKIEELLQNNKLITNIKIEDEFFTINLRNLLTENQLLKQKFKDEFFKDSNRYAQALLAIDKDDSGWLKVLLGVDHRLVNKHTSLTQNFEKEYILKCKLEHKLEFLKKQLLMIKDAKDSGADITNPSVLAELYIKLAAIEEESKNNIIVKYNNNLNAQKVDNYALGQAITDSRVHLTVNSNIDKEIEGLESYISHIEEQYDDASKKVMALQSRPAEVIKKKFTTSQERLLKSFDERVKFYLTNKIELAYLQDFKSELIQLPPIKQELAAKASIEDVLLFYATTNNKPNCIKLLLKRHADITVKSLSGVSLLGLTIRKEQSYTEELENGKTVKRKVSITQHCRELIFDHLKQDIKILFENDLQEFLGPETAKLNVMKNIVTKYLEEMVKVPHRSPFIRFFSSLFTHHEERENNTEDYINFIKEANKHEAFQFYLNKIVKLARTAGRGLLNRSALHEAILKEASSLLNKFENDAPFVKEYLERLVKAKNSSHNLEQKLMDQGKQIESQAKLIEQQRDEINEVKSMLVKNNREKVQISKKVDELETRFASLTNIVEMNSLDSSNSSMSPLEERFKKEEKGKWTKRETYKDQVLLDVIQ
jgi:hypothetical protein